MSTSLLDMNILDTPELETVPAGEYRMRIIKATVAKTKPAADKVQRFGLNLTVGFATEEGKKIIKNWLALESTPDATTDQKQNDSLKLKGLLVSSGLSSQDCLMQAVQQSRETGGAADVPELIGCEPWAVVSEPAEDPVYGLQNRITRFVTSK